MFNDGSWLLNCDSIFSKLPVVHFHGWQIHNLLIRADRIQTGD